MKIVFFAGASSIHTIRWVNEMAKRKHEVYLLTIHHPIEKIDKRVKVEFLPFPPPYGYYMNFLKVRSLLRIIKPDILHCHYASGYGTLARLSGFHPTLLSVWGSDVFDFPSGAKWKESILRKNLEFADYIASTSYIMKIQTERFVNPKHAITITPFGVDCKRFKPILLKFDNEKIVIGTVKSLEEKYGIEYLIKAFVIIKKDYKGTKCLNLLIAGEGSLKNHLMSLAKNLGVGDETEFLGFVPHSDVPKILNRLYVYVAVSDSESFGVAVVEASACGIPVIVSDAGGLPEVVKNNVTGFIVPRRNPEAIAEAIMKLIKNVELRRKMGTAGRNFVLQNYEWNENVSRMEKLYERIIKEWKVER